MIFDSLPPPAARYDGGMGNGRWLAIWVTAAATPLLLALLYGAGYFCLLVIHYPQRVMVNEATGQLVNLGRMKATADYRVGGGAAKAFFAPAEALDRKLRPAIWDPFRLLAHDPESLPATATARRGTGGAGKGVVGFTPFRFDDR